MIWTDYFTLIKVLPGRIVTPRFGSLDFADPNLPVDKVKALYEEGFPYLQLTPLGMKLLYPMPPLSKLPAKAEVSEVAVRKIRKRPA